MPIIVFLIDTSPSMGQKIHIGGAGVIKTYLDVAKDTVELFIQLRSRHCPDSVKDRYILLTFDEPLSNVKSGWLENCHFFKCQLKNLQCNGCTTLTNAIKGTYDFLNLFRKQCSMDTYGFGWRPFRCDPTTIVLITDGGCAKSYVAEEQVTKQFFRWDQRLFTIVLRIPAQFVGDFEHTKLEHDVPTFENLSAETGGRSYKVLSEKVIQRTIFNMITEMRSKVSVRLEVSPNDNIRGSQSIFNIRTLRNVNNDINGNWPLPESYSIKPTTNQLYEREAHPSLLVKQKFINIPNLLMHKEFPMDEYSIQDVFLAEQYRTHAKYKMNQCWQVSMRCDAFESGMVAIGYLRIALSSANLHLYVLPYNYPELLSILSEPIENPISPRVIEKFKNYLSTLPAYYLSFFRRALQKLKGPINKLSELLPESHDVLFPSHIGKLIGESNMIAAKEYSSFNTNIQDLLKRPIPAGTCQKPLLDTSFTKCEKLIVHPVVRKTFTDLHNQADKHQSDIYSTKGPEPRKQISSCFPKTLAEIARRDLVESVGLLRQAILHPKQTPIDIKSNSMPIALMGNYQAKMQYDEKFKLKPLWPSPQRCSVFGNSNKDDNNMMIIDETDNIVELNSNTKIGSNKELTPKPRHVQKRPISPTFTYTDFKRRLSVASQNKTMSNSNPDKENNKHSLVNGSVKSSPNTQCSKGITDNQHEEDADLTFGNSLRMQIYRCIRRPGRDYTELFEYLSYVTGEPSKMSTFINDCLKESERFHRTHMKNSIEQWWNEKQQQMKYM